MIKVLRTEYTLNRNGPNAMAQCCPCGGLLVCPFGAWTLLKQTGSKAYRLPG